MGRKRVHEYERWYVCVPGRIVVPDFVGAELRSRRFGHVSVLEPVRAVSTGEMGVAKTAQTERARSHD